MHVKGLEPCLTQCLLLVYHMNRLSYISISPHGEICRWDQLSSCKCLKWLASQHVVTTTCWRAKDCTLFGGGICLKAKTGAQFRQLITFIPSLPEHSASANSGIPTLKKLWTESWPSWYAKAARSHAEHCHPPTQVLVVPTEQLCTLACILSAFQLRKWRRTPWHTLSQKPTKIISIPFGRPGLLCLRTRRKSGTAFQVLTGQWDEQFWLCGPWTLSGHRDVISE